MSSIVADELAKIKSFETETEKRRSTLTLNELNYISDKQLHKKSGGPEPAPFTTSEVAIQNDLSSSFTANFFIVKDGVLFSDRITVPTGETNTARNVVNGTTIWFSIVDDFNVNVIDGDIETIPGPVSGNTHPAIVVNSDGSITINSGAPS